MTLRLDIRDRRLKGGRLSISAATDKRVVQRKREAAIRTLLERGEADVVERLRTGEVHISTIERAVREGDYDSLRRQSGVVLTVGALCSRVLRIVAATQSEGTLKQYRVAERHLLAAFGADEDVASIGRDEVRDFLYRERKQNGRKQQAKPWSPRTQVQQVALIGRMWREAIDFEAAEAEKNNARPRLVRNPWREVETPEVRPTRVVFLRPAQWRELARTVAGTHVAAPLAIGCLAGLRLSETIHLRTDIDVDMKQRRLHVQPREGEFPWKPKRWRSVRTLRIGGELERIIADHVSAGFAGYRYLTRIEGRDRPMSAMTLESWTKAAFTAAGIKYGRTGDGLTYHSLRHSFASWLVQRDVQLKKVAELLGDTVNAVERSYAHLLPHDLDRAIDLVDDIARSGE